MTCDELVTYLSAYIDQELDEELTAAAREHLATCQNCRAVLHTTRRVIQLGHDLYPVAIPPARGARLFARLQEAFLTRKTGEKNCL